MAQNKHKTKRRLISILCASIIALYALAIPIGAVVNSSKVPEGSTALYGESTFPYSVGFVCSDENLDRNYIFATEIGTYGLNNNQTTFGEDQFQWQYPDSTDTETTLIEYSGVDQLYLRHSLRWYANRAIEYGSNYGYTYGGYGHMNLEYYTNTQDFVDNVESIIFKASDVFYNTIWLTHQDSISTFSYLDNPTPIEFMMPTVMLPILDDYTTKAFVGAYSVECTILDDRGNTNYISYSVPIDTREKVPQIPFIEYEALKDYIVLNNGVINDAQSCKTLLITDYRGYLDVDYYEYVEPDVQNVLIGVWEANDSWTASSGYMSYFDYLIIEGSETSSFCIGYENINFTTVVPTANYCTWAIGGRYVSSLSSGSHFTIEVTEKALEQTTNSDKIALLASWLQANCSKQGSTATIAEEGTWEIVPDSREKNKVSVTFPMYDTSESQGIPPYASSLFSYPTATKFAQSYESNIDIGPSYPTYDEIPEDMYQDYSGWLGKGVAGFFNAQIFPGITLGGIVGVMVMFGCAIALLKIFAGG